MENVPIETWLMVMGMSGLGLALAIGVVKSAKRLFKGKSQAPQDTTALKRQTPQFEDEVQIRVFRQQADRAFQSISAVIDEEYRNLLKMVESGRLPANLDLRPPSVRDTLTHSEISGAGTRKLDPAGSRSPYADIETYVKHGMSVSEISRILSIPQDEVELAVKFRPARTAGLHG